MTSPSPVGTASPPRLSICIATRNRADFIGATLDSIVSQLEPGVEVVVVDGASTDATAEVVGGYARRHPTLRYFREAANSGVDGDYDKAVGYAAGTHCWLMTDDDLLVPGAVGRVLSRLDAALDLLVVNAEVRDFDLRRVLVRHRLGFGEDRSYGPGEAERLFAETGDGLSFIGCVVVRRAAWLARDRASYLGTLFVHVGVLFQEPPLASARVLGEPAILIRYGNANWRPQSFEIWAFKWPRLVWSFPGPGAAAKARVSHPEPWRTLQFLLVFRSTGAYGLAEYRRLVAGQAWPSRLLPLAMALVPGVVANGAASLYCALVNRRARGTMYDLARSRYATWLTRWAARVVGVA
jgi:hypothetical protein